MKHPVQCAKQQEHFASLPRGWLNRGYNCPTIFLLQGNPSKCNWRQRISCTFPLQDRLRHFKALKARTVSIMWYCKSSVSKMVELGTQTLNELQWHLAFSEMAFCPLQDGLKGLKERLHRMDTEEAKLNMWERDAWWDGNWDCIQHQCAISHASSASSKIDTNSSFTPGMVLAVPINAKYRFVSSTLTLSDSYQKPYKWCLLTPRELWFPILETCLDIG